MDVILFNTLGRKKEPLRPLTPGLVRLYTCGPTVYNYLHVGNYRTYVFEDVLKRALKFAGFSVRHAMNITDVGHLTSQADEGEDKMEVGAAREGKTAWEIARFYERAFLEDAAALDLDFHPGPAPAAPDAAGDVLCRATDHIAEQIELVRRIEAKGLAYRTSDGIYFDTAKFPGYGRLAGESHVEGLKEGARVQANPEKKNATDFALWKFSPAGARRQMEWDSPWGKGFPGWHIECSAMAMKYLGESFDIHCGGVDHIPIHHANEIAQSESATGKPLARFWMHGEFLLMNKAKMAKSAGGFIRLQDLREQGYDALDFRYFCYGAHYRRQLDFSWEALDAAKTSRRRLREAAAGLKLKAGAAVAPPPAEALTAFQSALSDDLNVPEALASVWESLRREQWTPAARLALIKEAERVLALGLFKEDAAKALPPEAQALFERYKAARAGKNYVASDVLRRELMDRHKVHVFETKEGSRWEPA
ncbi:MAG TPA: cysteine--tRNA ligase [Elusimicrobiota bacterium]|nr:cysteine--tRNA ligase [Elusimicrobiota bacterium]